MSDRLLKESDVLRAIDKRIEELSKDPVFIRKNGIIDIIGVKKYILAIPSVERPKGEWIDKGDYAECSNCGAHSGTQYDGIEPVPLKTKYCPDCGAKMKGVDDKPQTSGVVWTDNDMPTPTSYTISVSVYDTPQVESYYTDAMYFSKVKGESTTTNTVDTFRTKKGVDND